jgi:putative transposase
VNRLLAGTLAAVRLVERLPAAHRRKLRTANSLERIHKELKRGIRVAKLFPNEQSAARLVTAVLMEISEDWETNRTYLAVETN